MRESWCSRTIRTKKCLSSQHPCRQQNGELSMYLLIALDFIIAPEELVNKGRCISCAHRIHRTKAPHRPQCLTLSKAMSIILDPSLDHLPPNCVMGDTKCRHQTSVVRHLLDFSRLILTTALAERTPTFAAQNRSTNFVDGVRHLSHLSQATLEPTPALACNL